MASTCPRCGHSLAVENVEACSNFRCENFPQATIGTARDWDKAYPELPLFNGRRWGNWELDAKRLRLSILWGSSTYWIDLTRIRNSAAMLDWIFQVEHKGWATEKDLADLLRALDDIFRPQENFCSQSLSTPGEGESIEPSEFLRARVKKGPRASG